MTLYTLRNQHRQWLDKSLNWVDHCPPGQLFKTPHRDVAVNQLVELNSRDISLRGAIEPLQADTAEGTAAQLADTAD